MEQELQLTRQKLEAKTAESDGSSRERGDLIARCSDLRQKLDSAEETRSSLEVENLSLKRDRDQASALSIKAVVQCTVCTPSGRFVLDLGVPPILPPPVQTLLHWPMHNGVKSGTKLKNHHINEFYPG